VVERTSGFVTTATKSLDAMRSADKDARDVLLEVIDAGRESMRTMTELPKNAASRFIDELEQIAGRSQARPKRPSRSPGTSPSKVAAPTASNKARRPRRRAASKADEQRCRVCARPWLSSCPRHLRRPSAPPLRPVGVTAFARLDRTNSVCRSSDRRYNRKPSVR
jgi:hypothetical protein